jgi:3-hydroxyisobutyrate dehydrogenase-like beta-hydroxyacid dehydrogenase
LNPECIKELVINVDVAITIVGFPSDVKEVYFDIDKIMANAKKGTMCY